MKHVRRLAAILLAVSVLVLLSVTTSNAVGCAPQKLDLSLSNLPFKAIFVMQPAKNQR
jgi:hypothetical protein